MKSKLSNNRSILKTISGVNFCKSRATLHLKIGEIEDKLNLIVVKNNEFNYDLLLGLDAIKKFRLIQDENLKIKQKIDNRIIDIEDIIKKTETDDHLNKEELIGVKNITKEIIKELPIIRKSLESYEHLNIENLKKTLEHLNIDKKKQIIELFDKYQVCFATDKYDVGSIGEAQIKLKENKYVSKKPYRCSFADQEEIESQISKLLENDLIEESSSPFASPVTLAFKKEDGRRTRLCVDFRDFNKIVVPEPQPFPRIEDLVVNVGDCNWFSILDINSAFWSIPMRKTDREKTAFITQKGHWQWKVLPFGFKNSPAIFQRVLASIIRKYNLDKFCVNYIDDILIFSKSINEHLEHIEQVFEAIKKEGIKLKLEKCGFAKHSVKYLGHVIENGKVCPIKDNLIAIKEFPRPTTKKMVRQLLGKINFYHKFIDHCTQRLAPLHNLLKKNNTGKFKWTEECENCFKELKQYLCSIPILAIYNKEKNIVIEVDASRSGLGAVMKQPQEDGFLHPVAYFSKKLTPGQAKKEIMYLECLAIKEAIVYWQYFLIGKEFIVTSDHKPLINLKTKSRTDEALGDLMLYLSQYNFKVIYKKGEDNIEADALSRNPVLEVFDNEEDCLKIVNIIKLEEIITDQKNITEEIGKSKKILRDGDISFKVLKNRKRIYVSKKFGSDLINKVHQFYGHIGSCHIAEKLRPFYYFKNMDKIINRFCKECEICMKNKTRKCRAIGLLSKLGPAKYPFHIVSIDTIGGFGGNRSVKKYMHLLVDHFTRYAWILTSSTQVADDFIKLTNKIKNDHEIKMMLVDQYSALNSNKFKEYLKMKRIQLLFTSVDNPSSNGLNERLNQTLVNRIRCKLNDNNEKVPWTRIAELCVKEYNNTIHSTTKFSPAYLLYGEKSEIIPCALQRKCDLGNDRMEAYKNSEESFNRNKKRIDKNRKEYDFMKGDLVYVSNGNKLNRNKLEEVRSGPFVITRKLSKSIYEVKCNKKRKEANLFHCSKLIPYSFSMEKKSLRPAEV